MNPKRRVDPRSPRHPRQQGQALVMALVAIAVLAGATTALLRLASAFQVDTTATERNAALNSARLSGVEASRQGVADAVACPGHQLTITASNARISISYDGAVATDHTHAQPGCGQGDGAGGDGTSNGNGNGRRDGNGNRAARNRNAKDLGDFLWCAHTTTDAGADRVQATVTLHSHGNTVDIMHVALGTTGCSL